MAIAWDPYVEMAAGLPAAASSGRLRTTPPAAVNPLIPPPWIDICVLSAQFAAATRLLPPLTYKAFWRASLNVRYIRDIPLVGFQTEHSERLEYWVATGAGPPVPEYDSGWVVVGIHADLREITADFDLSFSGLARVCRGGVEPTRGVFEQHPDERHFAEQWQGDASDTADGSIGTLSYNMIAGAAFSDAQQFDGPRLMLEYDYTQQTGPGRPTAYFENLVFMGESAPCDGIDSANATGSGDDIECADDWFGGPLWWHKASYADLPILQKWFEEYKDARLVDNIECGKAGGPLYVLEEQLKGMDFPRIWPFFCSLGTWTYGDQAYLPFWIDPTVDMTILASAVHSGGSHEHEADADLVCSVLAWPKNATGRSAAEVIFDALNVWVPQGVELEFKNAGARCSDWAVVAGGVGITVTNGAGFTRFQVAGGGSGHVKRTLVVRHGARIGASATPWIPYRQLYPQDADEDHFCLSPEGTHLGIYGYFAWAGGGNREFVFALKHKFRTNTDNHDANDVTRLAGWVYGEAVTEWISFPFTVAAEDNGVVKWHMLDLDFGDGEVDEPDIFLAEEYRFEDLVAGDDIRFTSMMMHPQEDRGFDSGRVQVSVPFSHAVYDHFGLACLVGGHQSWHLTEDNLDQLGVQQGLAGVDYLLNAGSDVSLTRLLHHASFMRSIDDMISAQGSWEAERHEDVDAALGLSGDKLVDDHAFFLRQVPAAEPDVNKIVLPASLKCASFRMAGCCDYEFAFEGVVRGPLHGLGYYGDREERAGAGGKVEIVLCDGGVPTDQIIDVAITDEWGHYVTEGLHEQQTYAVKDPSGGAGACQEITNTEKHWADAPTGEERDPDLRCDVAGRLWQAYALRGDVAVRHRPSPQRPWVDNEPIVGNKDLTDPSIVSLPDGRLVVAAHKHINKTSALWISNADGEQWQEVQQTMAVGFVDIAEREGIIYAAGVDIGQALCKFAYSEDQGTSWSAWQDVATCDETQPAIEFLPTGEIVVSVTLAGVVRDHSSRDYGAIWIEV